MGKSQSYEKDEVQNLSLEKNVCVWGLSKKDFT